MGRLLDQISEYRIFEATKGDLVDFGAFTDSYAWQLTMLQREVSDVLFWMPQFLSRGFDTDPEEQE